MMNKGFEKMIGQDLEVYVDDMIIKRNTPKQHRGFSRNICSMTKVQHAPKSKKMCFWGIRRKFLGQHAIRKSD